MNNEINGIETVVSNILPSTTIYFCNIPLTVNSGHTFTFDSLQEQNNYFDSKKEHFITKNNYVRKNKRIVVDGDIGFWENYNYIYYNNGKIDNYKNYYAFITSVNYISESSTEILFEIDAFQSFYFDIQFKNSFVEREIVEDDTVGLHTIEENLMTGEMVKNNIKTVNSIQFNYKMYVADVIAGLELYAEIEPPQYYTNIPTTCYTVRPRTLEDIALITDLYNTSNKINSIISCFLYPVLNESDIVDVGEPKQSIDVRNNKLLVYPYSYLNIDVGENNKNYNYELMNEKTFKIELSSRQGVPILIKPTFYNNVRDVLSDSLFLNNNIQLPIISDTYKNWIALNGDTMIYQNLLNSANSIVSTIQSPKTALSNAMGVFNGIANSLIENERMKKQPDTIKGAFAIMSNVEYGMYKIIFSNYNLKVEFAEMIDNYFTMYGYKVNTLKEIKLKTRKEFNYYKTIGCNVIGNIPNKYLIQIKELFNNGITLWHNTNNIYNYDLRNEVI